MHCASTSIAAHIINMISKHSPERVMRCDDQPQAGKGGGEEGIGRFSIPRHGKHARVSSRTLSPFSACCNAACLATRGLAPAAHMYGKANSRVSPLFVDTSSCPSRSRKM